MSRSLAVACLVFFTCTEALPQSDVRVSPPGTSVMRGGFLPNGRFELKGATMLALISTAWGVDNEKVFGGPGWLDTDRFDIVAKAPPESTEADRALMLRALLADRFGLVAHEDNKSLAVFALTQTKRSSQLTASEGTGVSECHVDVDQGPPLLVSWSCAHTTMAEMAAQLRARERSSVDRPVVDMTGLKGAWNFTVKYTPLQTLQRARAGGQASPGISLFEALDKIGLRLEAEKQMVPVIAVDRVNRTPTENAPEVSKNIPPAPAEFEVADIKPVKPGPAQVGGGFRPGGRLDIQGATLKTLIAIAWDIDDNMIAGGPKWIEIDRFDIVAKAPESSPEDTLRLMVRSLLEDRFKLKTHMEDRPVPVFALTAGKSPKLKEADPASRTGCRMSIGQAGSGAASVPLRICTCQNITMALFAEFIRPNAAAYIDRPVVDLTGLKGGYDFTLSWTGKGMIKAAQGRPSDDGGASEPTGGQTVFEAVDRQLGLKLEGGKKQYPLPVVMVDRAEPLTGAN